MATMRTFIAIELDKDLQDALSRLQQRIRDQVAPRSVRWVRPEGIHLTLKFLGDTPEDKIGEVKDAVRQAAARAAPFFFTVGGVGCFPNSRRPRVLWTGLQEPTGTLAALRDAVEAHVAPLGFPTERRPFRPHLTLGRVQRWASASDLRKIGEVVGISEVGVADEFAANAVAFIKSDLGSSGAVYSTLCRAALGGNRSSGR